jgi:bifunctional DNA-binding transcriptional regulator/antitoxin component of YhaV-PrlF toxin-antitoxin module
VKKNGGRQTTGHVGRRGTIVLPAATRRRYGLNDGSLYMADEREDGILIRVAKAIPLDLKEVRAKIQQGLDELDRGEGIPGDQAEAGLKAMSRAFRAQDKQ